MFPMPHDHMAEHHMRELLHEAEVERMLALVEKPGWKSSLFSSTVFSVLYNWTRLLLRRNVVLNTSQVESISVEASELALRLTFARLHEKGVVSDYDDCFLEQFVETFERELAGQRT